MTETSAQKLKPCKGCGESMPVVVHLIGDVKICSNCVHLMMNIIEDEAPEFATWNTRAIDPQISDLQARLKCAEEVLWFYARGCHIGHIAAMNFGDLIGYDDIERGKKAKKALAACDLSKEWKG